MKQRLVLLALALAAGCSGLGAKPEQVDLSPRTWQADYERFMQAQGVDRTRAGAASGRNGAVTVAYNGLAARAGLEALEQGGNAIDAALTTALAQVALTAGAPISYFGILSLVYYDAETDRVYTMNAEWNTVLGEDAPLSIPGGIDMSSAEGILGTSVSGRTALVGGFMKGVGAAHERFGSLPFEQLFQPSIYIAEEGLPISAKMAGYFALRNADLSRLPETRATFVRPDGSPYAEGDVLRQPALAETLRQVAEHGTDHMYAGPWAERLVAAIASEGGRMKAEDLAAYEVIWDEPLVGELGKYRLYTNPPPNDGGVALIEAQQLALASGLLADGHWTESGAALRKAVDIAQMGFLHFLPGEMAANLYPEVDLSPAARLTPANAQLLWDGMQSGTNPLANWMPREPKHSDDVVAIDARGNIAAITHSINCVLWGKTAIVVDGITIGDAASFQQAQIAQAGPGKRLRSPTETGILFEDGRPVLGFASMGSGLHHRTFQCLLNVMQFGMSVEDAINTPDFFMPQSNAAFQSTMRVPAGKFPREVLDATGHAYEEIDPAGVRFSGEGVWVGISRDPETGELRAGSHNRNNSAAVAY